MESILKASYGDVEQRQLNVAVKDAKRAKAILEQFKERKPGALEGLPQAAARQAQPPFWVPKLHGTAYGNFNPKQDLPQKIYKQVEVKPGQVVRVEAKQPAAGQHAQQQAAVAEAVRQQAAVAPELAKLEELMRRQLRRRAAVHMKERTVLLTALAKVLGKRDVDMTVQDKVTPEQFIAAWKALGVPLSLPLAGALFNKYGRDAVGRLPVTVFVESLIVGEPRQLMLATDVQHGAFKAGKDASHLGKIQHPHCKKGLWAPSDWDPRLAERSARAPDAQLALDYVYGYDVNYATSPNLFYTATGEVAYYAAAVGVVYDPQHAGRQRFFLGHDDDICCLGLHPDGRTVASGQLGKDPCALVWDSSSMTQLARLQHGYGYRGIQAVAFSSSGTLLATIATDNPHTLFIWDWRQQTKLLERRTQPGAPPAVYGVVWSRFHPERLVTYGQNHVRFWELQGPGDGGRGAPGAGTGAGAGARSGELEIKTDSGMYGKGRTHSVVSACFVPSGLVITGAPEGQLGVWKGCKCVREVPAHAKGPPVRRPDGTHSFGGVRCLLLTKRNTALISAGADGHFIHWDVSNGDLGSQLQRIPLMPLEQMSMLAAPPAFRSLDCHPSNGTLIASTSLGDIWEVGSQSRMLLPGNQGDLYGIAMNPAFPHVFACVCESETVTIWNALAHQPIKVLCMGMPAASAAFTPDGRHLAVGTHQGGIKVLEFHPDTRQVWWGKPFNLSVDVMQYSPDGRYLAAGSHDRVIDIFAVSQAYTRVARCVGSSSTIKHIDWSADSKYIQVNDQAYEQLYFEARTGKQVKDNLRDVRWSSWTCALGFPVMGIWPHDSDGTDVNSVDRSPSGRYLVTADDFGKVKLFNYPCVIEHAPSRAYGGHSSHVMNVRWSADERYAVSVGGKDRAVLQWRLIPPDQQKRSTGAAAPWVALDPQGVRWGAPGRG